MRDLSVLLGLRIRALRTAKGWSQEEFAYQCGFHRTYISHVELGRKNVALDNLGTISTTLGVTLSELFLDIEKKAVLPETGESPIVQPVPAPIERGRRPGVEDVNRLLTELRLQRLTMEQVLAGFSQISTKGLASAGPKLVRKRSRTPNKKA